MMEPFERIDIQELPLRVPSFRHQVEDFLGSNGLRLGEVDLYMAVLDGEGAILAGGGLQRDILKCLAVSPAARSLGLSVPLISRLISVAADRGFTAVKVFTKPENRPMFESLGFKLLASAPKAILMENGRGLEDYCAYLRRRRSGAVVVGAGVEVTSGSGQVDEVSVDGSVSGPFAGKSGEVGVIVMNANPFTLGHRYLVEQAACVISNGAQGARKLVVIPVKEDASRFSYEERVEMIRQGSGDIADVVEGSDYQISAATFPTYFLKDLSDAAETQMRLDIDLFGRHIAPALGATVRFVGSEPEDALTARYNELMKELLPSYGVRLVEIPRLKLAPSTSSGTEPATTIVIGPSTSSGTEPEPITASRVRALLDEGCFQAAAGLTPASTHREIAGQARDEGRKDVGPIGEPVEPKGQVAVTASRVRAALDDGKYQAASALTPASTWPYLLAELAWRALRMELDLPMKPGLVGPDGSGAHGDMDYGVMRKGIDAIRAYFPRMAMAGSPEELRGLGIEAERAMLAATGGVNTHRGAIFALGLALYPHPIDETAAALDNGTSIQRDPAVKGAMQMAREGYRDLFEDWLPYYRSVRKEPLGHQKTLLRIMSMLDDTCVIHRAGYDRARQVKAEAEALLQDFSEEKLKALCDRYAAEGISPGGAADMLALAIYMDSILQ